MELILLGLSALSKRRVFVPARRMGQNQDQGRGFRMFFYFRVLCHGSELGSRKILAGGQNLAEKRPLGKLFRVPGGGDAVSLRDVRTISDGLGRRLGPTCRGCCMIGKVICALRLRRPARQRSTEKSKDLTQRAQRSEHREHGECEVPQGYLYCGLARHNPAARHPAPIPGPVLRRVLQVE